MGLSEVIGKNAIETGKILAEMGIDSEEEMLQLANEFEMPVVRTLKIGCPRCGRTFWRAGGIEVLQYVKHWLEHKKEDRNGSEQGTGPAAV